MDPTLKIRLSQAKQSLHEWYDALNRAWQETEDIVVSMNVGRDVAVFLYSDEPAYVTDPETGTQHEADPGSYYYLGFIERDGKRRICYGEFSAHWDWSWGESMGSWRPVAQCSKELRTDLAADINRLLAAVVEEAEKIAGEVEWAVGLLKEAITPFKRL